MTATDLLRQVQAHGGAIWPDGNRLELEVPEGFPDDVIEALKQRKDEILTHLRGSGLMKLPFPIGYTGLPLGQVEAAIAWLDKVGCKDEVLRKYQVVSWVRSHLQWQEQNHGELYEAIKREQTRLGCILDSDKKADREREHEDR